MGLQALNRSSRKLSLPFPNEFIVVVGTRLLDLSFRLFLNVLKRLLLLLNLL